MIRRGLKVLIGGGITCLGAALSFGAAEAEGFGPLVDGTYVYAGNSSDLAPHAWFGGDDGDYGFYFADGDVFLYTDGTASVYELDGDVWRNTSTGDVLNLNPDGGWWVRFDEVDRYISGNWPHIPDAYEANFPDWASAGVKIPLGFGIGMAFWAVMLGFGVPMRWVKELTNAAT